jgi:hypothetical protein
MLSGTSNGMMPTRMAGSVVIEMRWPIWPVITSAQ